MAIEIVDLPIKNGDFPLAMLVYQRVHIFDTHTASFTKRRGYHIKLSPLTPEITQ